MFVEAQTLTKVKVCASITLLYLDFLSDQTQCTVGRIDQAPSLTESQNLRLMSSLENNG